MVGPNMPVRRAISAPRRGVVAFFSGLAIPFRAARFVYFGRPALARYWIVPILVTFAAFVGSTWAALSLHDDLTAAIWTPPAGGFLGFLHGALDLLVAIVLVLAALAATVLVSSVVAAPFNALLADAVDHDLTGRSPPGFALGRAVADVFRALVLETTFFALNTALLVASILAPPASPILGVVGAILGSLYFAIAYVEAPQTSRGRTLGQRLRFVARHPMAMLGFGTGVGLFVFVPLVNLLFIPAAVAGGVMLHAKLDPDDRDEDQRGDPRSAPP